MVRARSSLVVVRNHQAICEGYATGASSSECRRVLNRCIGRLWLDLRSDSNTHCTFRANSASRIAPYNSIRWDYSEVVYRLGRCDATIEYGWRLCWVTFWHSSINVLRRRRPNRGLDRLNLPERCHVAFSEFVYFHWTNCGTCRSPG